MSRGASAVAALAAVPAGGDIRDIRGPIPLPASPPWALYGAIAAGALLLAFIVWRLYRWRKGRTQSPYQRAMARLRAAAKLIGTARPDDFADTISDTIRSYVEARFPLRASHATTEEFLADLVDRAGSVPALAPHRDQLAVFLCACDLAKFAGKGIAPELMRELLALATALVEETNEALKPPKKQRRRPRLRRRPAAVNGATP